jgi:hypothetical protein
VTTTPLPPRAHRSNGGGPTGGRFEAELARLDGHDLCLVVVVSRIPTRSVTFTSCRGPWTVMSSLTIIWFTSWRNEILRSPSPVERPRPSPSIARDDDGQAPWERGERGVPGRTSLRWSSSHVTVNDLGLFAFPLGVTTTTSPVVAPAGTVAVIVW